MIVIPKLGKDASQANILRSISLLSARLKLYERLGQCHVRGHFERLDVRIPEQFNFQESHFIIQLLLSFESTMEAGCQFKTTMYFLDVTKAFNYI